MKKILPLALAVLLSLLTLPLSGQHSGYEVFKPIGKYLSEGDTQHLGAWFDENLELSLLSRSINCSRNQAVKSLSQFFIAHPPHAFRLLHKVSKAQMKYCLGELRAGNETYEVTIFLILKEDHFLIQQLKIDRRTQVF